MDIFRSATKPYKNLETVKILIGPKTWKKNVCIGQGWILLFGHPGCVLKRQLGATNLLLAQVDVFAELSNGIQGGVMLKAEPADLWEKTTGTLNKEIYSEQNTTVRDGAI